MIAEMNIIFDEAEWIDLFTDDLAWRRLATILKEIRIFVFLSIVCFKVDIFIKMWSFISDIAFN